MEATRSQAGYFYVDVNGRTYWSQSKKEELSGPDEPSQAESQQSVKSSKQSTKKGKAEEPSELPEIDHVISTIETTEEFLKANGIAFKVSSFHVNIC